MNPDENIPRKEKGLKFGNADEKETDLFIKMVRRWLQLHNKLDEENKISNEEIIFYDARRNFTRLKIFVDFLELSLTCPNISNSMLEDFVKFAKFLQNVTKRILVASKKIKQETTIFTDLILLNYPELISKMNVPSFQKLLKISPKRGGVIGFSKAFVLKVKPPTYLLWSKKIIYTCDCKGEKTFYDKSFNIFKFSTGDKNFSNNLYDTFCSICKKEYIQDKNSEIFIECQEITLAIDTEVNCLVNNLVTIWAYGEFINSVKEGNIISIIAFYMPSMITITYEKDFEYGHFVALNFNLCFESNILLKEKNFQVEFPKNILDNVLTTTGKRNKFSSKFNDGSEFEILRSIKFQKQLSANFSKLMMNNFLNHYKIFNDINFSDSELIHVSFLSIALNLSISQRDYLNKISKVVFFESETLEKSKNKIKLDRSAISGSRNLLFKTNLFERNEYRNQQEEEIRKHFRLAKQIDYQKIFSNTQHDLLTRPLNLFLIFDDLSRNSNLMVENIYSYCTTYPEIIKIYPFINNPRFSKENLLRFFISCSNGIILLPDIDLLQKNEIELINSVMNDGCIDHNGSKLNLSISFWFLCSYPKLIRSGKKNQKSNSLMGEISSKTYKDLINKSEIVLNFSKKFNNTRGVEIDHTAQRGIFVNNNPNFITDFSLNFNFEEFMSLKTDECTHQKKFNISFLPFQLIQTGKEMKLLKNLHNYNLLQNLSICKEDHFFSVIDNPTEDFNDSFSAAKLMEDYFIIKRQISNVNFDDLFSILRVATFCAMLRRNYNGEKIVFPKTIVNLNYLDVILAIFFYEEYSVLNYGLEASSFGNLIPKIIYSCYSEEFSSCVNEFKNQSKANEDLTKKTPVPVAKSSLKKISLNEINNNIQNLMKKKEEGCGQCSRHLKLSLNEKIEDFMDKLTVFTYNN
jgi:hypothetical protein